MASIHSGDRNGAKMRIARRGRTRFTVTVRPFDFVAVFYSVVLGVAVAQLMTGVGRLVEERRRVRNYWVHSVWILAVLLSDADNWWSLWSVRDVASWRLVSFLLLIALTALIFLMTVLLFPRPREPGETIDLREHYYENSTIFLRANAGAWGAALLCNWTIYPSAPINFVLFIPGSIMLLSLLVARTRRPIYHATFGVLTLAATIFILVAQGARIR